MVDCWGPWTIGSKRFDCVIYLEGLWLLLLAEERSAIIVGASNLDPNERALAVCKLIILASGGIDDAFSE